MPEGEGACLGATFLVDFPMVQIGVDLGKLGKWIGVEEELDHEIQITRKQLGRQRHAATDLGEDLTYVTPWTPYIEPRFGLGC